jgi:hypothetical protein
VFRQGGAPGSGCATVNVWFAIVSVPTRATAPVLAAAVNKTTPFPSPVLPELMVSHGALLVDVQPHPGAALTWTDPDPPLAGTAWLVGAMPMLQAGAPWLTWARMPLTTMSP